MCTLDRRRAHSACIVFLLAGLTHRQSTTVPPPPIADESVARPSISPADRTPGTAGFRPAGRRVFRVTAYCDRALTAAGIPSGMGQCAAPEDIPFGAIVYVPQLRQAFVVTDRTHKRFRRNTLDLFMHERQSARRFGRRYLEAMVWVPLSRPAYGSARLAHTVGLVRSHGDLGGPGDVLRLLALVSAEVSDSQLVMRGHCSMLPRVKERGPVEYVRWDSGSGVGADF